MDTETDEELETRPYSIITDKTLGMTVNPYPFLETDLLDVRGEIPEQCFGDSHMSEIHEIPEKDVFDDEERSDIEKGINAALLAHNLIRVEKPIDAEVELVSTNSYLEKSDPEQDPDLSAPTDNSFYDPSVFALAVARGSAELIIDPVFLGWRRSLRIISYLKATRKILMHKKHLIQDSSCIICEKGYDKWEPNDDDLEYARFGMTSEQIGFQSWTEPAPGAWGWIRPASIVVPMIDLDPSTTLSKDIGRLCTRIQRFQRWAIMEWGRMNPFKIRTFFARMIRNSGFRIFYKSLYDVLRLMYLRIFCEPAPKVNQLEKELNDGVEKVYQEEKKALEKVEIEVSVRRERVAYMEEVRLDWKLKERTRWRERIPELPLWKRRGGATGKKRARSQSRSRSRVVKPKKTKLAGKVKNSSILVPVQPASLGVRSVSGDCSEDAPAVKKKVGESSGRPGTGISSAENPVRAGSVLDGYLTETDDVRGMEIADEVIEENLAESSSRVLLTTRRRKRSRSRSGNRRTALRRVLTHDELCEDLKRVIQEDEPIGLDGEEIVFEIPPEIESFKYANLTSELFYKIKVFSVLNVCVLFPGVEMCWLLDQSLVWNLISHFFLFGSFFCSRLCRAVFRTPELRSVELPLNETIFSVQKKLITGYNSV